ncbi:unnamed protein product [Rhizoctonia solani]|uniref:Uncharacterized protein n=1 Tax=Rhizoctonia solani TaxID=456999 RepID=A0A8H3BWL6_9AGAM|nr:unnamed protein product [Rhizoctonia solani]
MPLNTFAPSRPRNESQKSLLPQPQPSKTKSGSPSSQNSLTRRNSAPLLGAVESVRPRPKVDTSLTYQRPGMTPINKPVTPVGNLSTFGTPYNASWETSRTESIPRPSTAPLPDDDDHLVGGVHYTTYGGRDSQVYEAPFSDVSVPVPQELLAQAENEIARSEKEKVKGHRRSGSALLRMVGVEPAPEVEPKEHTRPRKLTLNSIMHPAASSITHQASQNSFAHTVNSGSGTESTRGTMSADDTTLISMSRFPLPPDSGTPRTPGTAMGTPTTATMGTPTAAGTPTLAVTPTIGSSNRSSTPIAGGTPRPNTPGSMITIHPNTPSTPAIPDFLAASRTSPEEQSARSTPGDSRPSTATGTESDPSKPKLRTRGSLLALAMSAAAVVGVDVDGRGNDTKTEAPKLDLPLETPKTFEFSFPLPEHMKANSQLASTQPEATHPSQPEPTKLEPQARPRPSTSDPFNPRRRSLLERLTARITTPIPDTTIEDVTWNSVSSDWTDAEDTRQLRPGPVIDFDLAPEEPLMDMEQFGLRDGSWSPIRQSATFPPMASTPKTAFPTSHSTPLSPTRDGARSPTNADPLLPQEPLSPTRPRSRTLSKLSMTGRKVLTLGGRPSARNTFSNTSRTSRRSRRAHGRGMSGDSIPTRMREGGRLESLTRRGSADALSAEGTMEGTVLYGVGEEMLRLMFAAGASSSTEGSEKDQLLPPRAQTPHVHVTPSQNLMPDKEERERERTRSLPRPRASLVPVPEGDKNTDLGSLSYPSAVMPLNVRRKGHRRGTASKENASLDKARVSLDQKARLSVDYKVRPSLEYKSRPPKSRSRSKSAPLGISQRQSVEVVGILTNGNNSGRTTPITVGRGAGRVVIVNSATTPGMGTPTRKTALSNPLPPVDTEASQTLVQPGVIVTAPTPPAPRRSLSMPIEALPAAEGSETGPESPRGTVSRGTSVQFVPESFEGRRRGGKSRKESALVAPVPEVNGNGKGKRKVEREPTDASDASAKKPRLSVEDMDITFMGEPLFGGQPQHRRGGLGSQGSSHPSTYSRQSQSYTRHSQSYSRHSQSYSRNSQGYYPSPFPYPSPTSSPDPERASIPMHAIFTPRVQSLYGTGAKPDYVSHRQSISSIPRPKSRASARSNATGARSYRSNATGARSNVTGARSNKTSGSQRGPKRWQDKLPMQGWCFLVGFFIPFVWWYAAFARAERGYYGGGVWSREVESQWEGVRTDVHRDDGRTDLLRFSQTCRSSYSLVENSARLRLQIELGANGLQVPHRWLAAGGHSQELLEALVQCRDDWLDLRLAPGVSLPRTTSGQRFTLWELRRGVFVSAFSIGEHRPLEADALKIITLDLPVSEWTLKFETTFHELTIDPAQDLLVLAVTQTTGSLINRLDLHLCSLRTGLAHPSAKLGIISFDMRYSLTPHHIYSTVSLSITNDILLVSLIANSSELYSNVMAFDWKAGILLIHTVFEALISNTDEIGEAITGKPDSLGLLVYDRIHMTRPYADDSNESRTYSSNFSPRTEARGSPLRFEFPALDANVWILATDFLVRASPVSDHALRRTPDFVPDYACRTLSLSLRIISGESPGSLLIFIDSGMLITHLERAKAEGLTSIPWAAWGEYSTRWIYYLSEPNPWINWVQGTRYVLGRQVIDEQNDAEDSDYIAVVDFHPATIRRFMARNKDNYVLPPPEQDIQRRETIGLGQWAFFGNYSDRNLEVGALAVDIVDADTPTVLHGLGPDPIISRLPYRLVVARPGVSVSGCSDWMIDDNRIVGIGPNPLTGQFGDLITIQSLRSGSHATRYDPPPSSKVVETIDGSIFEADMDLA